MTKRKADRGKEKVVKVHPRVLNFMKSLDDALYDDAFNSGALVISYLKEARRGRFLSKEGVDEFLRETISIYGRNSYNKCDIEQARNVCYGIVSFNNLYERMLSGNL